MNGNIREQIMENPHVPSPLAGREDVWNLLCGVQEQPTPALAYVWGAPGTGKTFLLQHFRDQMYASSRPALWSAGTDVGQSEGTWRHHLGRYLGLDLHGDLSTDALAHTLVERCRNEAFCWIVDDFDRMRVNRDWIVHVGLDMARHGGTVVLVGRASPFQLWPAQSYVKGQMQLIELSDWDPDTSRRVLASRGVTDPALVDQVIQIARGRPKLLDAVAEGLGFLRDTQVPTEHQAFLENPVDLSGFLIEHICHPGSRRLLWRAGQPAEPLDTLIAAAAVAPMFNREWMTRVAGRALVAQLWDEFITLPFLDSYRGGYHGLFPDLRRHIAATVQKVRPWMWEHWVREATNYYLARLQSGQIPKQHAWGLLSAFLRPRIGESVFDIPGPQLETVWDHESGASEGSVQVHLMHAKGSTAASASFAPEPTRVLHVTHVTAPDPDPAVLAQLVSTLASTFYLYDKILWSAPDTSTEAAHLLHFLGFTQEAEGRWCLDFAQQPFIAWLQSVVAPPQGQVPDNPIAVVQTILQALRDDVAYGPEVDAFWASISAVSSFRAWFLDALNSADLGERVDGKTVLVLYYLDQRGTHEELAEMLHVSRATYFRNHRNALERLAEAVFH